MRTIAVICARAGSKGLPGKNIKSFMGKPLIAHSIDIAKRTDTVRRVIVSTDCSRIADIAVSYGAEVPFLRPPELAQDNSPEWLVWKHVISWLEQENQDFGAIVVLPPTAPLRSVEDVNGAINMFCYGDCDGVVCGVEASRNPLFNMVTIDADNMCSLAMRKAEKITRRQDAPIFYDLTTVCYVMKKDYVKNKNYLFDGNIKLYLVPPERAIDIDTPLDFSIAELMAEFN